MMPVPPRRPEQHHWDEHPASRNEQRSAHGRRRRATAARVRPGSKTCGFWSPEVQREYTGVHRAREWVGLFLPHLRPGMPVLDLGCSVGSITLDLPEIIALLDDPCCTRS